MATLAVQTLDGAMNPAEFTARPSRDECNRAIKILTQYERLAAKFGKRMPPARVTELNSRRDAGEITIDMLPAFLHREWPGGRFDGRTLSEIRALCGMGRGGAG
jgi:hypothetical protein